MESLTAGSEKLSSVKRYDSFEDCVRLIDFLDLVKLALPTFLNLVKTYKLHSNKITSIDVSNCLRDSLYGASIEIDLYYPTVLTKIYIMSYDEIAALPLNKIYDSDDLLDAFTAFAEDNKLIRCIPTLGTYSSFVENVHKRNICALDLIFNAKKKLITSKSFLTNKANQPFKRILNQIMTNPSVRYTSR